MVSLAPPTVRYEPLSEVVKRMKTVSPESDTVITARDLGIAFGD
jgi:6-phosphofructokinase 1